MVVRVGVGIEVGVGIQVGVGVVIRVGIGIQVGVGLIILVGLGIQVGVGVVIRVGELLLPALLRSLKEAQLSWAQTHQLLSVVFSCSHFLSVVIS